jgi:hypothetical protein
VISAPRRTTGPRPIGVVAIAIPVVGFSLSNLIVKSVPVPALTFAFWRLWCGATVMLAVAA